jgi:hypothetical protein
MAETQYLNGVDDGKNVARQQILDYIQHHLEHDAPITPEDIADEILYLARLDLRNQNG